MIAKLCAFLLCCFALILNTKTMESTSNSQITHTRLFIPTPHINLVRHVDNVRTFKKSTIPKQLLGAVSKFSGNDKNLKIRYDLEKKARDIKCSFCVIAKSNAEFLNNVLQNIISENRFGYDTDVLRKLREILLDTTMIVELLLAENLKTGKWLWTHFLKTFAIEYHEDFTGGFRLRVDPFKSDSLLQTGVSEFIDTCIREKNLPEAAMAPEAFILKNSKGHEHFLKDLRRIPFPLDRRYSVLLKLLYLQPFWEDHGELLFGQIAHTNVDWNVAKEKHLTEVPATRTFFENRTWIYTPYERMDHQLLLVRIIDARLYCHLAVRLHVFEKQLTDGRTDPTTLGQIKNAIANVVQDVLKLTAFKDQFLVAVISDLKTKSEATIEEIRKISTRVKAKANEILNELHGSSKVDLLIFTFDRDELNINNLTAEVSESFKGFMNELKSICSPFDYRWLLHFLDLVQWSE